MRVLYVTGEYPPMQGGVGDYTQELSRALCARDLQVYVVTSQRAARPTMPHSHDGVRVMPTILRWDWSIWRTVSNLAQDLHADWIHVQYQTAAFGMHPAINLAPRRWRQRHQVAWTYHDLLVPYLFPKAGMRLRNWITRRPAHTSNLVVVTNEGDQRTLNQSGVTTHNIPIGSNITGLTLSPSERQARRQRLGYCDDDLILGYFGFLNRSKGGLTLIRALARIAEWRPNTYLLMIGDTLGASDPSNDAYLQQVNKLINELGIAARVKWTGQQAEADVAATLNACDVLLMPYLDGASLRRGTLMAGLANGCAIVTTEPQAPLTELVDGRDLLYVPPDNDAALAEAVQRIATDPGLATRLRTQARVRSQLFTWESIAEHHCRLYAGHASEVDLPSLQ